MTFKYEIFEGFDHFTGKALYRVSGKNNDYVGEWHTEIDDAKSELLSLDREEME